MPRQWRVEFRERSIDAIFRKIDSSRFPGAAVGIAIDGRPVYRKGFGLASMELPVVLSPTLRMRIGSTTKQFACLAYLLLCESNEAHIDDRIGKYLPELHPVTRTATMRQLMGHVSGLRDVLDIVWTFSGTGAPVSSAELLALYRDIDDVNAPPGSTWLYNNGGYLMLSAAVERIVGKPLEAVLRERIFAPLGMNDTSLRRFDTDFLPNSATLHTSTPDGGFDRAYLGTALTGEGGVVTTVDDLLRWLGHMDAPVLGNAATWEMMKAPQRLLNGCSTGYGLGLMSYSYRGADVVCHAGGVMGGNAQMLKVPAAKLDVVVLVNRHDVLSIELANQILDTCLADLDPVPPASARSPITGVFRSTTTGRVVQLSGKAGQQIATIDGVDWPFVHGVDNTLTDAPIWGVHRSIHIAGDPRAPTSIRLDDYGSPDELQALESQRKVDDSQIPGRYRAPHGVDAELLITTTVEGPQLSARGRFGSTSYSLEHLAGAIWRARHARVWPPGGILSFSQDYREIQFTTSRTRALRFHRVD